MARFTKVVEFEAFQFVPERFAGIDPFSYEAEEVVASEFEDIGIRSTHIDERGRLSVVIYTYDPECPKQQYDLNPGEWLVQVSQMGEDSCVVMSDEFFKQMATPLS